MEQRVSIGQWQLLNRLGSGNLGVTWQALDVATGGSVALKLLHPVTNFNQPLLERLRSAIAQDKLLEHPGIVPVYQMGSEGGQVYIVSEYVPVPCLAQQLISAAPFSIEEACRVVVTAADALAYSHAQGIAHGNLKPSNILVPPSGAVRLTDFGLAAPIVAEQPSPLLDIIALYGNPAYLAPELVRGGPPTPASDIYALGLILYQMLTGHPAFEGGNTSLVQQQLLAAQPEFHELKAQLPPVLVNIISTAISKKPAARYPDIAEFASSVRDFFIPWYTEQLIRTHHAAPSQRPAGKNFVDTRQADSDDQVAPPTSALTPQLVSSMPHKVSSASATRRLAPRALAPRVIVPRSSDHIKGPTLPTRMLSLSEVHSRWVRFWLVLVLLVLLIVLLLWAVIAGLVRFV